MLRTLSKVKDYRGHLLQALGRSKGQEEEVSFRTIYRLNSTEVARHDPSDKYSAL